MKRQNVRKTLLLISMLLFPVTLYYLSPYLILVGGFMGVITGSLIIFVLLFLFSLFFGRAFCGWVCPAGAIQESLSSVNEKKANGRNNIVKYIIWVPWILTIILAFIKAGGIKDVDFFFMTDHGISVSGAGAYIIYFFIVSLFFLFALLMGKRAACHTICWMAPFMIFGTKLKEKLKIPSLHIKYESTNCINCGRCNKKCPMGLEVSKIVQNDTFTNSECILCGECVDICDKKAITFKIKY